MPAREEPGEGGWIIAAADTVIDPVFAPTGEDPESKSAIEDDSVMVGNKKGVIDDKRPLKFNSTQLGILIQKG